MVILVPLPPTSRKKLLFAMPHARETLNAKCPVAGRGFRRVIVKGHRPLIERSAKRRGGAAVRSQSAGPWPYNSNAVPSAKRDAPRRAASCVEPAGWGGAGRDLRARLTLILTRLPVANPVWPQIHSENNNLLCPDPTRRPQLFPVDSMQHLGRKLTACWGRESGMFRPSTL